MGIEVQTDADISAHARKTAGTVYHPAGTCQMVSADDHSALIASFCAYLGFKSCELQAPQFSPV